jgi:recombinational DNA repair protein (RecF pathway)
MEDEQRAEFERERVSKTTCVRCGSKSDVTTCSRYNSDTICLECAGDEQKLPTYPACKEAEFEACMRKDFNYHHGLTVADRIALAEMRKARITV